MIFILTVFIVLICVRSHDFFLKLSSNLSFSIILVLLSHLFHVLLFSFIYFIEIDNMQGSHDNSFVDLIYYSISTYTTLGIGDIHFNGSARIVSGIQAIFGLIMIAWSASHIYLKIEKE